MNRRRLFGIAGLAVAAIAGSVATIAVRGSSAPRLVAKPPRVTTATVVRTSLSDSILTPGILGYTGAFTVTTPSGVDESSLTQAEAAVTAAGQTVSADEASLQSTTSLENHSESIAAASAQFSSARATLASARRQLTNSEQLGCLATSTSSTPASSNTSTSLDTSSAPQAPLDTSAVAPVVSTATASGTTAVATEISGTVNPNGASTSYFFRYGTTAVLRLSTPSENLPAENAPFDISATLQGLTPNTTYLFVLVATNAAGTTTGIAQSFTTDASSCAQAETAIHEDGQAVTQARDALDAARTNASSAVAAAQQQLVADRASATYARRSLALASASAINPDSVLTWVAPPNATIRRGQTVYALNDHRVPLLYGTTVLSRALYVGGSNGPDVQELNANLVALGFARGVGASQRFSATTESALRGFQTSLGLPASGELRLGDVVVAPGPIRITKADGAVGTTLQPGSSVFDATSTARVVTVPLNPNDAPPVTVGESVSIVLPSNATTPGRITSIGPIPPSTTTSSNNGGSSSSGTQLTVLPTHPSATGTLEGVPVQVSLTTETASNVLAVPISALLALSGGGYGLEIVEPSGAHRLVGVTTGLFSNTLVEVRGGAIRAGTKVIVAQ
ncbi:MAG: peptidoglycan-binding protein [Acidimicrobiales bacterium]